MKAHPATIALLALPLLAACSGESQASGVEKATTAAKEMGDKAKDMAAEFTQEFNQLKADAETRIANVDAAVADLRKNAAAKGGDLQKDVEKMAEQIVAKRDEVKKLLAGFDLKKCDMQAFGNLKSKIEPILAELGALLDRAKSKLGG